MTLSEIFKYIPHPHIRHKIGERLQPFGMGLEAFSLYECKMCGRCWWKLGKTWNEQKWSKPSIALK